MNTKQIIEIYKNRLIKKETIQPSLSKKGILCCMESNLYSYNKNYWEIAKEK